MSETLSLGLPLLAGEQAQKHVTVNEALAVLDALVQLAVKDRGLAAPPGAPAEGDRYIVAAGATGAWTGHDHAIAVRQGGAWAFHPPREGWRCWVDDENAYLIFNGAAWVDWGAALGAIQGLSLFGLGTTADAANPFSAKLNRALWTAKSVAEGGDGDLRTTMNKETAADVLSILLQRGFAGRAEIRLIGDDDLSIKVSPDGAAWITALALDKDNGSARFIAGSAAEPGVQLGGAAGLFQAASGQLGFATSGTARAIFDGAGRYIQGHDAAVIINGLTPNWQLHATGLSAAGQGFGMWIASSAGGTHSFAKSRTPTIGTQAALNSGDTIWNFDFLGSDGVGLKPAFRIRAQIDGAPGADDMPGRLDFMPTPDGSATPAVAFTMDNAGNLKMGAAREIAIDASRHFRLRAYTLATLPSASPAGQMIFCSDLGGGGGQLNADGASWRRVSRGGQQNIASDAAVTLTALASAEEQRHTGTLTADRTITLAAANAYAGARFRVARTGGGAFNLSLGGLKNLATGTWAEVVHDGAGWYLAGYGAL